MRTMKDIGSIEVRLALAAPEAELDKTVDVLVTSQAEGAGYSHEEAKQDLTQMFTTALATSPDEATSQRLNAIIEKLAA